MAVYWQLWRNTYQQIKRKVASYCYIASADEIIAQIQITHKRTEELITFLKNEIPKLEQATKEKHDQEFGSLKEENERLKQEIETWKAKVFQLERMSGTTQCASSGSGEGNTAVTNIIETNPSNVDSTENKPVKKRAKKSEGLKKEKYSNTADQEDQNVDVSRLDLRIGRIISVIKHPDAESLYVEEIDVGEEKPRTVVSGLIKYVPLEEMQNRLVVVLCNLKPAKMRGVTSEAMVMCASTPEKVEILTPPEGSQPGDRVTCDEYPGEPDTLLLPKRKIFEQVALDLKTNADFIATYKQSPLKVSNKGFIMSTTLANVLIN